NDTGRRQAQGAARLLARRSLDAIYTSPLSRASETAQIISDQLGLGAPIADDAFVERDYGEAEGLTRLQINSRWRGGTPVPGQESRASVQRRVTEALHHLAIGNAGKHFVVTTHGGVIRSMLFAVRAGEHRSAPIT